MSQQIDSACAAHSLNNKLDNETHDENDVTQQLSRVSPNVRSRNYYHYGHKDEGSTLLNVEDPCDFTAFLHKRTLNFSRPSEPNSQPSQAANFNIDDIPPPPSSSSSSSSSSQHSTEHKSSVDDQSRLRKRPASRKSPIAQMSPARKKLKPSEESSSPKKRGRYYLNAFNFVNEHVLKRYTDILHSVDVDLIRLVRKASVSENALALFVRLYRRQQPQWFRVQKLYDDYKDDIDVDLAITELSKHGLLISSKYALMTPNPPRKSVSPSSSLNAPEDTFSETFDMAPLLANELLGTLSALECKSVCSSLADGAKLRKLNKHLLLPSLKCILADERERKNGRKSKIQHDSRNKKSGSAKLRQSTLSGLSQADCLSRAILKMVGHCIRIPSSALKTFQRIHFLFFLEDGYDSPNVILADTQKVRFPKYKCEPSELIFLSARGYEDYEEAVKLECALNDALEAKKYEKVAHFGSIAELEVREFLGVTNKGSKSPKTTSGIPEGAEEERESDEDEDDSSCDKNSKYRWLSIIPQTHRQYIRLEAETQLRHPFFKRYTAIWVYVRTCWYSVHALERLGEYESAIERLKLLLSTSLMPRRRGKCLNRLTINLERHVKRLQESLDIIIEALHPDAPKLNFGDRIQLAMRGASVHGKLYKSQAEKTIKVLAKNSMTLNARKKAVASEIVAIRPKVIADVLNELEYEVAVQKIYGQSIQQRNRERIVNGEDVDRGGNGDGYDHANSQNWFNQSRHDVSNSRDSLISTASASVSNVMEPTTEAGTKRTAANASMMGKSMFSSFHDPSTSVSVEEYCLEWYHAKQGWNGVHDEGASIRFIFCLLMWEQALFADVSDVFQTPYQDRPLDLGTESFYESRKDSIEERIIKIDSMSALELYNHIVELYDKYEGTRAVGCIWDQERYPPHMLGCVASGLGSAAIARCCALLCEDYSYWGSGLPDLTLWKDGDIDSISNTSGKPFAARLVEVKSARDNLSDKQKAWLFQLTSSNADCQVCKVVEKVTAHNAEELQQAKLSYQSLKALKTDHQ